MQHGGGPPGIGVGAGNLVSSNSGYSGTPLWKLKQQGAVPQFNRQAEEEQAAAAAAQAAQAAAEEEENQKSVAVDAVSLGRADGSGEKPLVRHVIVKDLRKVAARSKMSLPTEGIFADRATVQLFALFDGQSCADAQQPGPLAAEWCAKQVLPKLLRNLSALPPGYENVTFVKASLTKTFEDLDKEILKQQPGIHDGCGASVGLLVGEKLFTSVVGKCEAVLCEQESKPALGGPKVVNTPVPLGAAQGNTALPEEQKWISANGGVVYQGGVTGHHLPPGTVSSVTRSLGDRMWKGPDGGIPGSIKLLRGSPQTTATELSWSEKHQFLVINSAPVAMSVSPEECVSIGAEFPGKPRASSGEIATKAAEMPHNSAAQCTSVVVYFMPKTKEDKTGQPPPAKKARKEAESVRLRHIVVKHRDCGAPFDPVRNRPVARTREEAETMLRRALRELNQEAKMNKTVDNAKAKLAALQPTPKYVSLCKEISECTTAQKGGGMMGDLGWLSQEQLSRFGPAFADTAKNLGVGQWSDLASSEHGVHILQRIA